MHRLHDGKTTLASLQCIVYTMAKQALQACKASSARWQNYLCKVAEFPEAASAVKTLKAQHHAVLLHAHKGKPGRNVGHAETVEQCAQNVGRAEGRQGVRGLQARAAKVEHVGGVAVVPEDNHAWMSPVHRACIAYQTRASILVWDGNQF